MRELTRQPLDEMQVSEIKLDPKSRDDIPSLLRGLPYIFLEPTVREPVFKILDTLLPPPIDRHHGRPGMAMWSIFVRGVFRLHLNWDDDRLQEMVNHHRTVRPRLGHGLMDDGHPYGLQNLKDNVALLTPEILDQINPIVVKAGHAALKKKALPETVDAIPDPESLKGHCDSLVVETAVHYPTDTHLLLDALRKVMVLLIRLLVQLGLPQGAGGFRERKKVKSLWRQIQKLKPSTSPDPARREARHQEIRKAYPAYLTVVVTLRGRMHERLAVLRSHGAVADKLNEIQIFITHAERQIPQIDRRVLRGQTLPHAEKVFSIFEPHTEWRCPGKAGVPVEWGLNVGMVEDPHHFILHHRVRQAQTDSDVARVMVQETQTRFPTLTACSCDQGFHSPHHQHQLANLLPLPVLPKKGQCSAAERPREQAEPFKNLRRHHAAVESAIHALEVHGLDRCPDHGLDGFKRYVALAVVARNVQVLGTHLRRQENPVPLRTDQKAAEPHVVHGRPLGNTSSAGRL